MIANKALSILREKGIIPDVAQTITLTKALYKTATEELSAPANETVSTTITMTLM